MNRRPYLPGLICLWLLFILTTQSFGQSPTAKAPAAVSNEEQSAERLYQDANSYLDRRFDEFKKQNLPYDPELEAKTRKEQRELAIKNATTLQNRKSSKPDDVYYLGMLQHLGGDADAALETMRRFLANDSDSDKAQDARIVVVVNAVKKNLLSEAEAAIADYEKHQPLNADTQYKMGLLIADAYSRANNFDELVKRAKAMRTAAIRFAETHKSEPSKRDELLLKTSAYLADAYLKTQNKADAVNTLQELRRLALAFPSGALFKQASSRLARLDPNVALAKLNDDASIVPTQPPPEITVAEWIDQTPTKLSDLRGQVVLLDFWAIWCGPCRYTLPNLERFHQTYKKKGLVVLGINDYEGQIQGRTMNPTEELAYLKNFKKQNRLTYGFAVADSSVNHLNYGAFRIPMSYLIDRRGVVRYISEGASDEELAELERMIKKVLDEPVESNNSSAATVKQR